MDDDGILGKTLDRGAVGDVGVPTLRIRSPRNRKDLLAPPLDRVHNVSAGDSGGTRYERLAQLVQLADALASEFARRAPMTAAMMSSAPSESWWLTLSSIARTALSSAST